MYVPARERSGGAEEAGPISDDSCDDEPTCSSIFSATPLHSAAYTRHTIEVLGCWSMFFFYFIFFLYVKWRSPFVLPNPFLFFRQQQDTPTHPSRS
jgi:hypothetical protein